MIINACPLRPKLVLIPALHDLRTSRSLLVQGKENERHRYFQLSFLLQLVIRPMTSDQKQALLLLAERAKTPTEIENP